MSTRSRLTLVLAAVLAAFLLSGTPARAFDVVISAQGEFGDAYLVDGQAFPPKVVFIDPDPADPDNLMSHARIGRHVNGKLCVFPRGVHHNHQFVMADDTYREACLDRNPPQARCSLTHGRFSVGTDPDGWAVFRPNGKYKGHINTTWHFPVQDQGTIDPQGCVFDAAGNMWGNDVGSGDPGNTDPSQRGSLLVFFPGPRGKYDTWCFLDKTLHQAGQPAMDEAGNIYLAETGALRMLKYSPPFPTSAADCDNPDHLVTTPPTKTTFPTPGALTPSSIVRRPGTDHWYVDSVLVPGTPGQGGGIINEYDANGVLVRNIVPSNMLKNPLGMAVGSDGTLYYSEINLTATLSTGCGRVSMVKINPDGTSQLPPLVLGQNLNFPDGVSVVDSTQLKVNFLRLPPAVEPDPSTCSGEGSPSGAFLD